MHQIGGKRHSESVQHGEESRQDGMTNSYLFCLLVIKRNDTLGIFCIPGFTAVLLFFFFLIQVQYSSFHLLYAEFQCYFSLVWHSSVQNLVYMLLW